MTESTEIKDNKQERLWVTLVHLSGFATFIFPFGNIIAPLVIWLIKKDEFALINDQGKEALNFQISITIYFIISAILSMLLIGIPLMIVIFVLWLISMIKAAVKANQGEKYSYSFTIRFIK